MREAGQKYCPNAGVTTGQEEARSRTSGWSTHPLQGHPEGQTLHLSLRWAASLLPGGIVCVVSPRLYMSLLRYSTGLFYQAAGPQQAGCGFLGVGPMVLATSTITKP